MELINDRSIYLYCIKNKNHKAYFLSKKLYYCSYTNAYDDICIKLNKYKYIYINSLKANILKY